VKKIFVSTPAGGYDIIIGRGALAQAGALAADWATGGNAVLVSNDTVAPLYAETVLANLRRAGLRATLCVVPDGESYKNLATLQKLYDCFLDAELDRKGVVLALGGGVVGDMAGFAAATFLRGVPFLPLPTSLLAMVDASVGGKTAVDLPQGKNLVGAFKFPGAVIIDPAVLATLPEAELRSGMAEVVKHGLLAGGDLLRALQAERLPDWESLIAQAVQVKVDIVAEDPFEQGKRTWLNLGHTFGHALEQVSGYRLRHGFGVALGLLAAAHLSRLLGLADESLVWQVEALLRRQRLPANWHELSGLSAPPAAADVYAAMGSDKKRHGRQWRFVLLAGPGAPRIVADPPAEAVQTALAAVL